MKIEKVLHRTFEGGSCSICNGDYIGVGIEQFHTDTLLGYRTTAKIDGIKEPANVCDKCLENKGLKP